MALGDTFGTDLLVLGDNSLVLSTVMLGDDFGQVISATVTRDADREDIMAANGNLRAVVLKNIRFEMQMECRFDSTVTPPSLMEAITLPLAGVEGRIMKVEVKWNEGTERTLALTVSAWDALTDAVAYSLDTATGTMTSLDA